MTTTTVAIPRLVLCGHCGGKHTIPGVAICAATHHHFTQEGAK